MGREHGKKISFPIVKEAEHYFIKKCKMARGKEIDRTRLVTIF